MILPLFLTLLGLALFLIVMARMFGESGYSFLGFVFLLVLSSTVIMPGNLEIKNGSTSQTTNFYNGTTLQNQTITEANTYTTWSGTTYTIGSNVWFGAWLDILCLIGCFLSIIDYRGGFKRD